LLPILGSFYFSFFKWPGISEVPLQYVAFQNYTDLLGKPEFWQALKNVTWFVTLSLLTQLPGGFILALLLSTYIRGHKVFKTIFFTPIILSTTAIALVWYFILFPNNGVLNMMLTSLGLQSWTRGWLIDRHTAMTSIILITAWVSLGYYMTITFAAITGIPDSIHDAVKIDGATGLRRVFGIIVPMVWESLKISVVLIITGILKVFDIIFVMTEGGPNGLTHVLTSLMYYEAFKYGHYGTGSAISTIVFLLSITLTLLSLRLMARERVEYS
jgi:raffinose/stachyose/melibiose transport system permease protein